MGKLGDSIRARNKVYKILREEIVLGVVAEAGRRVIQRTPKKTGKLRSNWNVQEAAPDPTTREATNEEFRHGFERLPRQVVDVMPVIISNSLPYAGVVERGSSKQAPSGMARITAMELPQILREVAGKVLGIKR